MESSKVEKIAQAAAAAARISKLHKNPAPVTPTLEYQTQSDTSVNLPSFLVPSITLAVPVPPTPPTLPAYQPVQTAYQQQVQH